MQSLLSNVLERERTIWTRSGFSRLDHRSPGTTFELIEEKTILVGPHRIPTAFFLVKPDESLNMKRRASVAKLESSIIEKEKEKESSTDTDVASEHKDSTASLKEALIKNPSVIQLLNSTASKSGAAGQPASGGKSNRTVVFRFPEAKEEEDSYFCLPKMTAVGRIGSSTRLLAHLERLVDEEPVARELTIIIKGASERLHELLAESCMDPMKLSAELPLVRSLQVVYRECCIGFRPPAGLQDDFWPPDVAENSAAAKAKKPKAPKAIPEPKPKPSAATASSSSANAANANKQCAHCGIRGTPQWRRGPDGAGTLCNACGVKWKHGKLQIPGKKQSEAKESNVEPTKGPTAVQPVKEAVVPLKKRKFLQASYSSANASQAASAEEIKDEPQVKEQ